LDNPDAHYLTTGPEIYEQTNGTVTHFVMAASTGGTISGVGKYLKEQNKDVKCVLVDPVGSVLKGYQETGTIRQEDNKTFQIEGFGKAYIPRTLNIDVVDWSVSYNDN